MTGRSLLVKIEPRPAVSRRIRLEFDPALVPDEVQVKGATAALDRVALEVGNDPVLAADEGDAVGEFPARIVGFGVLPPRLGDRGDGAVREIRRSLEAVDGTAVGTGVADGDGHRRP